MNLELASAIRNRLWELGVHEYVIAAGARNAPFIKILNGISQIQTHQFYDERAAGFFALGIARRSRKPVAVVTTSGTAVTELLPCAVEAYYSGVPLIFVTADRPKSFRGSASPQSIEQVGIFGVYASTLDMDSLNEVSSVVIEGRRPTHLNVCFNEPLLSGQALALPNSPCEFLVSNESAGSIGSATLALSKLHNPVAIVSGLEGHKVSALKKWLVQSEIPCYFEGTSQLREDKDLALQRLTSGDVGLRNLVHQFKVDGIIHIGRVPTVRLWRDIEEQKHLQVVSFSDLAFSGLSWQKQQPFALTMLESISAMKPSPIWHEILHADRMLTEKLDGLLSKHRDSEPAQFRGLSNVIPQGSAVFVGNSLPIREWDLAATFENRQFGVFANRGANGIDGLTSTFLGMAKAERSAKEQWLIFGDLSALYDMNALSLIHLNPKVFETKVLRIVVINNRGGKIFSRMFNDAHFENRHEMDFSHWAKFFGWDYQCVRNPSEISLQSKRQIIEIAVDDSVANEFWKDHEESLCLS